jgi:cytochrome c553
MNPSTKLRFALAAGLLAATAAHADPIATPEKVTVCAACHGADGKAVQPMYPNLAGQYANYLEHALREYKAGLRKNPIMGAQAAALSDADIHQLAEYFSQQPSPLYTPSVHGAEK